MNKGICLYCKYNGGLELVLPYLNLELSNRIDKDDFQKYGLDQHRKHIHTILRMLNTNSHTKSYKALEKFLEGLVENPIAYSTHYTLFVDTIWKIETDKLAEDIHRFQLS